MQSFERSYLLRAGSKVKELSNFFTCASSSVSMVTASTILASPILWNGGLHNRHFSSFFEPFAVEPRGAISNFISLSTLWVADGGIGIHAGEFPASRCVFVLLPQTG